MKYCLHIIVLISLLMFGCSEIAVLIQDSLDTPNELTTGEVVKGLKEALSVGAEHSVAAASVKDGFYGNPLIFIPFPPEAVSVKTTLEKAGFSRIVDDFEKSLNRAAEEAVKRSLPVFKDAVTGMTITDAMNILKGPDDAATVYLRSRTEADLKTAFSPIVSAAVEKADVTGYWRPLATAYNQIIAITGGKPVQPDLNEYVTQRSLDGLFILIAAEEREIRTNPAARITYILKRVFGYDSQSNQNP